MNIHITNLLIKLNYFVLFAWPCMAMFISLDTPTRAPRSKMTVLCFAVCESHSLDPQRMSRSGCPQSTKSEANESKASTVLRGAHPSITSCSVRTRTLTCAPISRFSRRRHHNVPLSMRSSRINRYVPTLHISRFVPPRQEKLNRATGRMILYEHAQGLKSTELCALQHINSGREKNEAIERYQRNAALPPTLFEGYGTISAHVDAVYKSVVGSWNFDTVKTLERETSIEAISLLVGSLGSDSVMSMARDIKLRADCGDEHDEHRCIRFRSSCSTWRRGLTRSRRRRRRCS